jgi:phosphoribosylaminoimidazolecarboxamide formyltransferase/IMP cyclohydrolase
MTITRALISVSDKTNLIELASTLQQLNIEILATGGTAKLLKENNISITDVSSHTGFPEIMDGRVKTLHPKIHGGILARRGIDDDTLEEHNIDAIDLVVVNLYPFQQTVAKPGTTLADAIEKIDIGGPTMLRSAAKNHEYVTVVVDPQDYSQIISELEEHGDTQLYTRRSLALKVFSHTAQYDDAIANYLQKQCDHEDNPHKETLPSTYQPYFIKELELRYGENPHQEAAFYRTNETKIPNGTLGNATLLQGKALSYNNMVDADATLACVQALDPNLPGCVIVKHATPCGVAQADNLTEAYQKAFSTDSTSAFGGIIAFNQSLDAATAETIIKQQFAEVIIAPTIEKGAAEVLTAKKNLRVLECGYLPAKYQQLNLKSISGGLLVQTRDQLILTPEQCQVVTQRQPTPQEMIELLFAWRVVQFVKSNAIVYTNNQMTLGIGTGQTSRVFSAEIAALKAKHANLSLDGAAMASDAFFPFADGVEVAAKSGIKAVIQPGGSKRDPEVIAAADSLGLTMVMTGSRHFLH